MSKLRSIPLFSGLSKKELREVARHADEVDGSVEVRRGNDVVAELGPGDFFGETALIERGVRNATVTAVEPSTLMVMTTSEFRAMAGTLPSVAAELRRAVDERCATVVAEG